MSPLSPWDGAVRPFLAIILSIVGLLFATYTIGRWIQEDRP